jgi:hypothetical protein
MTSPRIIILRVSQLRKGDGKEDAPKAHNAGFPEEILDPSQSRSDKPEMHWDGR